MHEAFLRKGIQKKFYDFMLVNVLSKKSKVDQKGQMSDGTVIW